MTLRFVLAGGGTAGHVNPLLATARVLRDRGHHVEVLGTREGLEATLVPEAGYTLHTVPKVPIPRRPSTDIFTVPRRLKEATNAAAAVLANADVLIGYGGYVSAPAYFAAKKMGLPFVVQEQNVRPGWANRVGARNAAAVSLAFPQTKLQARRGKTVFTGLPLRHQIMELAKIRSNDDAALQARMEAASEFGLDSLVPTLLVTGGSLGAAHLNQVVAEGGGALAGKAQILHATGKGKSQDVLAAASAAPGLTWVVREYLANMDQALAAADLVLCRSGAGTVAELGVLGLPAFYVPLPIGNGEQRRNAEQQVAAGGALIVEDKDFTVGTFTSQVLPLLVDPARLRQMGVANRSTSPGDGAALLADLAESVV